jgi:hypothetical protein
MTCRSGCFFVSPLRLAALYATALWILNSHCRTRSGRHQRFSRRPGSAGNRMAVYEDGTRDCPGCIANEATHPNRVRGSDVLELCTPCDVRLKKDAVAGYAQLEPFMRQHLRMTDWLIEHGHNPIA